MDWLNQCEELDSKLSKKASRKAIIAGILARLPENDTEFNEYSEEIYFTGGRTKYKEIQRNSKFYSYMPYHVTVLLQSGVSVTDARIINIVKCLINGGRNRWKGKERKGVPAKRTSFTQAMALSTIATWLRYGSKENYNELIDQIEMGNSFSKKEINNFVKNVKEVLTKGEEL